MNAALYIRVSTDDQLDFSPDAQKRALIEYAKKNDLIVEEKNIFIDEGISGTKAKNRPAFQNMIATAKIKPKPFDVILVHKFDRFARSREDSVVYKSLLKRECDIKVVSITEQLEDDKFSIILEAMLEAMAEYYSLNLSDEVMKGMSEKARKGGVQGSAPFGYKIENNQYIIVPDEASIVKMIFDKIADEEWGYRDACANLLSMGIKTKKGYAWTTKKLQYMLQNPVYIGKVRWNYSTHKGSRKINTPDKWIISDGTHEPIIDIDTFNTINNKLMASKKVISSRPITSTIKHYLAGLLRCCNCNATLVLTKKRYVSTKIGETIRYAYRCNNYNKGSCKTSNYMFTDLLEESVKSALKNDFEKISSSMGYTDIVIIRKTDYTDEIILLENRLEKVRNKYSSAKNAYLEGIDTIEEYKESKMSIAKEETELINLINSKRSKEINTDIIKEKMFKSLDILENQSISDKDKNVFLKSFIDKIVVDREQSNIQIHYYN